MDEGTYGIIVCNEHSVAQYKRGGLSKKEAFKLATDLNDHDTTIYVFEVVTKLPKTDPRSGEDRRIKAGGTRSCRDR